LLMRCDTDWSATFCLCHIFKEDLIKWYKLGLEAW
jgi:hypothetical protein